MKVCNICGSLLKRYDKVKRIVKTTGGQVYWIHVERYICTSCKEIHRSLPASLLPYKHYEKDVIFGVLEGFITSETLGYENYPTDLTMHRWKSQKLHFF